MTSTQLSDWLVLSDQPTLEDNLGFEPYARTLAEIIVDKHTNTPLTIGIFGSWGCGKTSLMKMVQRSLDDASVPNFSLKTVWFSAWLYSQQQSVWRALLARVIDGVYRFPDLSEDARSTLKHLEARLCGRTTSASGLLNLSVESIAGVEALALPPLMGLEFLRRQKQRDGHAANVEVERLTQIIADLEDSEALTHRDQMVALEEFREQFEAICQRFIVDRGRLVVLVDDLDRCLPDQAVEAIEAIKLFLDVPGCIFVMGVAREMIEEAIRTRYSAHGTDLDGRKYLEKIIQIPFALPQIAPGAVTTYVHQVAGIALPDPRCEQVFAVGLEPNPRRIKRTLNVFLLLWRLAQNRKELRARIKPVCLAKIVIIQQHYPELFQLIMAGPHYLIDLEKRIRTQQSQDLEEHGFQLQPGGEVMVSAGPLEPFLNQELLQALLSCTPADEPDANFGDLSLSNVQEYVYLSASTASNVLQPPMSALSYEPQMVIVAGGTFLMGISKADKDDMLRLGSKIERIEREVPEHEVGLKAYAIGRYPVTNAEFARFVDDNGYSTPDFWTETGWHLKETKGWIHPRYWEDNLWNVPSHPVVGVSWYEAVAYCNWLGMRTGKPYRLPTEAEWEKASRGVEGQRYPWGSQWDAKCCNNKENESDRTTPVGQYSPLGDSPYGASDMAGEVLEWCSSKWAGYPYLANDGREDREGTDARVLRGGSWWDTRPAETCRCSHRNWIDPSFRHSRRGFRCARDLSI